MYNMMCIRYVIIAKGEGEWETAHNRSNTHWLSEKEYEYPLIAITIGHNEFPIKINYKSDKWIVKHNSQLMQMKRALQLMLLFLALSMSSLSGVSAASFASSSSWIRLVGFKCNMWMIEIRKKESTFLCLTIYRSLIFSATCVDCLAPLGLMYYCTNKLNKAYDDILEWQTNY